LIRAAANEFTLEAPGGATIYSRSRGKKININAAEAIDIASSEGNVALTGRQTEIWGRTGQGTSIRASQIAFDMRIPNGAAMYGDSATKNFNISAPEKILLSAAGGIEGSPDGYDNYPPLRNIALIELKCTPDDEETCNIDAEWIATEKNDYSVVTSGNKGILITGGAENALTPFYYQTGQMDLGSSSLRWRNIYATNGTIQTSDRNEKNTVEQIPVDRARDFILGLQPVTYKMNNGTSGRTHWGLIAQDVEELLGRLGIDSKDFAGFIKSPKVILHDADETGKPLRKPKTEVVEGEYDYSLRYDEFIAPMIKTIQNLNERLERLENNKTGG